MKSMQLMAHGSGLIPVDVAFMEGKCSCRQRWCYLKEGDN